MEYVILGFLFILSAFFSGSETALTTVNKFRIESKAKNGDKKAKKVLNLVETPDKMLTTILVGNNFINILISAVATSIAIKHFGDTGVVYSTVFLTICILVFSEITPKTVAAVYSEKVSYIVVLPIIVFMSFLKPFVFLMSKLTDAVLSVLSRGVKEESTVSSDDIKVLVNKGSQEGVFHSDELILLTSVLDFKGKEAGDAMKTPRVDVASIPLQATYEEVREIIQKERYSRYPVYEEESENIIGFFYAKDFVSWSLKSNNPLSSYIDRDVLFIPDSMEIGLLFKEMQVRRKHIAIVVDEYGGLKGLISLEDVIEEMIGQDINDEKDRHDIWIEEIDAKTALCMADVKLEKISAVLPIKFEEEADTLGEFVLNTLGEIPQKGDFFIYQDYKFVINQMNKNRIIGVTIQHK